MPSLAHSVAIICWLLGLVRCQITKTGHCPLYQTDRRFTKRVAEKIAGTTLYITHTPPGAMFNVSCPRISFNEDGTFRYQYNNWLKIDTYYDGTYDVTPTSLTEPGTIDLRFQYRNIIGSDHRGRLLMHVLWSTHSKLFTVADCSERSFGYRRDVLMVLASKEVADIEDFPEMQKRLLIKLKTPDAYQLALVPAC